MYVKTYTRHSKFKLQPLKKNTTSAYFRINNSTLNKEGTICWKKHN